MDYGRQGEETEPGDAIPYPTADPRTKREAHGPRPGKPKQTLLIRSVEDVWSENNFIFSILEQHDFTLLEYLCRKKKRKMMHFFPGGAGWAGLGWA